MKTGSGCPTCSDSKLNEPAYAYLLGLYLGDGCLSRQSKSSWKLRIVQDARYPGLIWLCGRAMATVRGVDVVRHVDRGSYIEVHSSWAHWICLFPQHGRGRKHERSVALKPWQQQTVEGSERQLLAGLIHADGSRHINEVKRQLADGVKSYRYSRYMFTNSSSEIIDIFTGALDSLGVAWTRTTQRDVSVARRADVAFLDTFIGPKH